MMTSTHTFPCQLFSLGEGISVECFQYDRVCHEKPFGLCHPDGCVEGAAPSHISLQCVEYVMLLLLDKIIKSETNTFHHQVAVTYQGVLAPRLRARVRR